MLRPVQTGAELLAEPALEALHAVLVGAGEDGHELAAAVAADDVFLPAELGDRLVELSAVVVAGLDPVDRERLIELIRRAAAPPVPRRPTRVPASARRARLETKKRRSGLKRLRTQKPSAED